MSGDFIDSNIFLYLFDEMDLQKRRVARDLVEVALATRSASISFQVVQETLSVMTTKLTPRATSDEARHFLEGVLVPLWHVMPSGELYQRAMDIQSRYRYSFYDSLIIAAALAAGCTRLVSEDLKHGQRIEGLSIENPFLL